MTRPDPAAGEAIRRATVPGTGRLDQTQMRRANMSLLLRHLRDEGGRSKARVSTETGLSKATVTSLVTDLAARGLVRELGVRRDGSVGRPGLTVTLDGRHVYGLGAEINVDYLAVTAVDLRGEVIDEVLEPFDAAAVPMATTADRVSDLVAATTRRLAPLGRTPIGLCVAAPGVIDIDAGIVRFASNIRWADVPLAQTLAERLDARGVHDISVELENDAKLGAVAEYARFGKDGIADLLYLTGDVGVGAGIIAGGRLVRGSAGFSGEVGHMPLDPHERPCSCGRRGCWERVVGLTAFLELAAPADDEVRDPHQLLADRLGILQQRAAAGDPRTLGALQAIADGLAPGLSILIDVLNPSLVVLGGYFAYFADHLLAPVSAAVESRRINPAAAARLVASDLGLTSAARGGAHHAIQAVFDDPAVVPALVSGHPAPTD